MKAAIAPMGSVVFVGGVLLVIADYAKDGFWKESEPMYLAFQLVKMSEYREHDLASGIPGTSMVKDTEWIRPLDSCYYKLGEETIVIAHDPFYIRETVVANEEIEAAIATDALTRAWKKAIAFLLNFPNGLTEEDMDRRINIRDGAYLAVSSVS